ncbi:MAG TPA: hypothetical protein VFZ29_04845 [Solirubrobacterales bacterium]
MGRKSRGGGKFLREAAQDPDTFARCCLRFEQAIESGCRGDRPWAQGVAASVHAALEFAEAEPVDAHVVVVHSASRRYGGSAAFGALVDRLAARLTERAPPVPCPERTARSVILRVMRQILLQLEQPRGDPTAISADLIVFALTPYVGLTEARRWAFKQTVKVKVPKKK